MSKAFRRCFFGGGCLLFIAQVAYAADNVSFAASNDVQTAGMQSLYFATALPKSPSHFLYRNESSRLPFDPNSEVADSFDLDLVDVDNDGDNDIFVAEGTAGFDGIQNRLLINDGHGFFTDETTQRLPLIENSSVDVDFTDINDDGFVDAVIANVGPTQLLLNNGHGHFVDVSSSRLPVPPSALENISLEINFFDVDHDGDKDILIANELPIPGEAGAQNRLYINDGTGMFSDETLQRLPVIFDQTSGFAFADIDHDGDGDIIVSNQGQNRVLINLGDGIFAEQTTERLPLIEDASRHVALGDVDGDGDLDAFIANSRAQQNRLYLNDGDGHFTDVTSTYLPRLNDTSIDVDLIDLNGDGALDALIANSGVRSGEPPHILTGEQNRCYLNTGKGIFLDVTQVCLPVLDDPSFDLETADVDGDGYRDIVIGNAGQNGSEQLYISNGIHAKVKLKFRRMRPQYRHDEH